MKDPNDNISEILYDALGMPVAMAIKGKDNGSEGDSLAGLDPQSNADELQQVAFFENPTQAVKADLLKNATWRCVYNFDTLPVSVGMIARQHHVYNPVILPGQNTDHIARF